MRSIILAVMLIVWSCSASRVYNFKSIVIQTPEKDVKLKVLKKVVSGENCDMNEEYAINVAIKKSLYPVKEHAFGLANVTVEQNVETWFIIFTRCFRVTGNPIVHSTPL